jgi:hypothetical protein
MADDGLGSTARCAVHEVGPEMIIDRVPIRRSPRLAKASVGLLLVALAACGESRHPIGSSRIVRDDLAGRMHLPPAARHGLDAMRSAPFASGMRAPAGSAAASGVGSTSFDWRVPDGWSEVDAGAFRVAAFAAPGDVEVSVSVLPGAAGGLAPNINRWRGQLGLGPLGPAEIDGLPTTDVGGRTAVEVDAEGRFQGQGRVIDGARMLALATVAGDPAVFVKMIGPAAAVGEQVDAFREFAASFEAREAAGPPAAPGGGGGAGPASGAAGSARGLTWRLPEGWAEAESASSMRLASFRPGGDPELDAYVVLLPGAAGGVKANLDRWLGQVGLPELTDAQLEALPNVTVLGAPSPVLKAIGPKQGILGTIATLGGSTSVFVKLVGPASKVAASYDGFVAFCATLAPAGAAGAQGGVR